jgi:hypothetical protein
MRFCKAEICIVPRRLASARFVETNDFMWEFYKQTVDSLFRLDSQEWFLAMCAALVIGFFALRGFGSRSNY